MTPRIGAVMAFGVGAAKLLISYFTDPIIYMAAGFDYLGDHFREVFGNALNWFIGKFDSIMKSSAMNLVFPGSKLLGSIPQISDVQPADSFSTDVKKQKKYPRGASGQRASVIISRSNCRRHRASCKASIRNFPRQMIPGWTQLPGFNALINEQLKMTQTTAATDTVANGAVVQGADIRKTMAAQEIALKQQLMELNQKMQHRWKATTP